MRAEKLFLFLLLGLAAGTVVCLVHLFTLRFAIGDVYPAYSSLRADPLGTKVLYDSLRNLPQVSARQNYQPLSRLCDRNRQTILYCGIHPDNLNRLDEMEAKDYENLAVSGNRFVISLYPVSSPPAKPRHKNTAPEESEDSKKSKKEPGDGKEGWESTRPLVDLTNRWGFALGYVPMENLSSSIKTQLIWHTALFFDQLDRRWQVTRSNGEHPVMIERAFGAGTIVLCADSYFLSNESMGKNRQPKLLAQVIGPNTDVVFDETHLGVSENPGVMTLARKYHLQGLLAAILLLVGLFIWKNSVSFLPRQANETTEPLVVIFADKDAAAGLVNLLRRSIPPQELLRVCWREWQKSFARGFGSFGRNPKNVQAILDVQTGNSAKEETMVAVYQDISQLLTGRK